MINAVVGYPGAVHDAKVFRDCSVAREPQKYFSLHEYIIGDGAYKLDQTLMTPFRRTGKMKEFDN